MSTDFKPLADAIYRDRVLRARRTPPEERIIDGPRLFDYACAITLAGLRANNPNASEVELQEALRQRLILAEKFDQAR